MKRRPNDPNREELEREAMAELQRTLGGQGRPSAPPTRRSSAGRSRAWGAAEPAWSAPPAEPAWRAPDPEPEPEEWRPSRQARSRPTAPEPEPAFEDDEELEEEWTDEAEDWEYDDPRDDGGVRPIGLIGVPLDYDATEVALEQLAQRANVRRPIDMVHGVDAFEAEQTRDRAMAQFLERQEARKKADAELAAQRSAAGAGEFMPKPAAFPPLSPGLSAKSLVMQPVAAPPLNRPGPSLAEEAAAARAASKAANEAADVAESRSKAARRPSGATEAPARAPRKRAAASDPAATTAAKKAVTKAPAKPAAEPVPAKPAARKAGTKRAAPAARAAKPAATKPAATAATTKVATTKAATTKAAAKKVATTKAATTKAAAKKVATKKVATKPVATKPAATKPATTKKAATKKAVTTRKAAAPVEEAAAAPTPKRVVSTRGRSRR